MEAAAGITLNTLARVNWEVRWVRDRRIVVVPCGDSLAKALRLYTKAVEGGRQAVTLRSANAAIAPPVHLRQHYLQPANKSAEPYLFVPLDYFNRHGWWWCPYCIQARKFVLRRGFYTDGQFVAEPGYYCPMCGISHRDGGVRKWNPLAARLYVEGVRAPRR